MNRFDFHIKIIFLQIMNTIRIKLFLEFIFYFSIFLINFVNFHFGHISTFLGLLKA